MNLVQELRQRRVPQIVSAYLVAGWGAIQFLEFLESRMAVSPHLVNLIGLSLLLLLPTVLTIAWIHGRPGRDSWGRIPKVVLPANLVAVVLLLVFIFNGRDLGAVTETIEVQDENGEITERVVPKNEYRRRVLIYYAENTGAPEDDWARETIAMLQAMDVSQDVFVDVRVPASMATTFSNADLEGGHVTSTAMQRKIAREAHRSHFQSSTIEQNGSGWIFTTVLHESESGREAARRTFEAADLFTLADMASRQIREDLGIPASQLENSQDLPVAEMMSTDIEAVKGHVAGLVSALHDNDWPAAAVHLDNAVALDSGFAIAQFLRFAVHQTLGDHETASAAIKLAMENLYRLPERSGFMIKYQYYFSEKQDPDKAMAVLQMWSQIYPDDIEPYSYKAMIYMVKQDLPNMVAAYERVLEIDPSQVQFYEPLADSYDQMGNYDKAEEYLLKYVELFPTEAEGYEDLSDFYSSNGHLDQARAMLEKAELLDPESLDLALSSIDLDMKMGYYEKSAQALESLLDGEENLRNRAQIYGRQINMARMKGQAKALALLVDTYYTTLTQIRNPLQVDLIIAMMWPVVSEAGNPPLAVSRIEGLAAKIGDPYGKLTGVGKAWALTEMGEMEDARVALTEAEEMVTAYKFETYRSSIALVKGMMAEAEGDMDEAVAQFRIAVETAVQDDPLFDIRLARALRLQGEPNEARERLEAAVLIEPARPRAHLELALIAHQQGKSDKAREHLKIAQAAWSSAEPEFLPAQEAQTLAAKLK